MEVLRGRIRLRGLCHVAPFEDGLPHGRSYRELGTACKEPRSVFGGSGLVVHGDVQHGGKLIVHVIALHGLQSQVVFQKVCLGRRLQILQICKYSDSWFQNNTPRRIVLIFVL